MITQYHVLSPKNDLPPEKKRRRKGIQTHSLRFTYLKESNKIKEIQLEKGIETKQNKKCQVASYLS